MLFLHTLIAVFFTSFLLCAVCSAQVITQANVDVQLVATDSYAEVVPAGGSRQIAFTADPRPIGGDTFHVVSSIPNATISLIVPGGTEITSANAEALGYSYSTLEEGDNSFGLLPSVIGSRGNHTVIVIPAASVPGSYSIKVVAPAGPEDTVVIAQYLSSSLVRAGLVADSQWYRIGDTVVFSALVFDGVTPVANASVTVAVDDSFEDTIPPVNINLQDSGEHDLTTGDGIYTGTFTPTRSGEYGAGVRVTGTAPGGLNFSRLSGTTFRVQEPLATFVSFSDGGVDDDSDGLFDRLVVNSNVSVQRAGKYQFSISLVASNGSIVKSESFADLSAGSQQMSASFSATAVLELGVNGPYSMKDAMLTFHSEPTVLVADHRANAGNTAAYTLSSFERSALFLTANRTAEGVDTNGNGKFDVLRVQAEVLALRAGFYQWSGVLADAAGNEIAVANSGGNFVIGSNFITLDFNGSLIGQHGVNGPYTVRSLLLFGANESIIVDRLLDTQAFSFKAFENSDNVRLVTVTTQETTGDSDTFVEPGESGSFSVLLRNIGGSTITGISATLSGSTPGVTITSAQSAYPSLAPSGEATNSSLFTFTLSSAVPCAESVMFTLTIRHDGDGGIASIIHFTIQPGRPTSASTFSYTGPAVAIPDNQTAGVNIPITISGFAGLLRDLNFRFDGSACSATAGSTTVGLSHTFVGDLAISLTSPSGTTVRLMSRPGASNVPTGGINFCNTVLDDEGGGSSIQSISFSGAPYSGTFTPIESLAAFRGEDPNGTWILNVADTVAFDIGTVRAFSLLLSGLQCGSVSQPIFSDNFNDNSLDTSRWTPNDLFSGFTDLSLPINETGQRLEIGPLLQNASGSHYRGIRTISSYNFTGAYSHVELVQPASSATKADAMFTLGYSVDSYYRVYVSEGNLIGLKKIGGVKTTLFTLPYDSINHRYLRIKHDAATNSALLETAPSTGTGPGSWTQRYSETWNSAVQLSAIQFELKAGTWQPETNPPGKVIFDNFEFGLNSPSASPLTITTVCPASGTSNGGTQVAIGGTGFLTNTTVRFGGLPATSVQVTSTSSIIATTPAHAVGSVDVSVTNANGQSATLANGYTYTSPPPQGVILEENFNDNCLNTLKWTASNLFSGFIDLSLPINETGQRLEIGPLLQNASGSHYRGIRTISTYDFTGAYSYVELVQAASSATKADAMFTIGYDVDNYYRIYVSEGNLIGLKKIGGVKTTLFTLSYDSTNHRYLRIRHDAATNSVVFEMAPSTGTGPGNWVPRYSETWNSAVTLSAIKFELKGGTWQPETIAAGKVIFDNFLLSR